MTRAAGAGPGTSGPTSPVRKFRWSHVGAVFAVLLVVFGFTWSGEASSATAVQRSPTELPGAGSPVAVRLCQPAGALAATGLECMSGAGVEAGHAAERRSLVTARSNSDEGALGQDGQVLKKHLRICGEARDLSRQDKSLRLLAQVQPAVVFLVSLEFAGDTGARDLHLLETPSVRILDSDGNPHPLIGYALAGSARLVDEASEDPPPTPAEFSDPDLRKFEIDYPFELIGVDDLIERGEGIIEVECHGEVFRRRFLVWSAISALGVDWQCGDDDNQIDATLILGMELPEDYATLQLLDGGRPVAAKVVEYDFWDDTWHVLWQPESWPLRDPTVVARVETAHGRVLSRVVTPASSE